MGSDTQAAASGVWSLHEIWVQGMTEAYRTAAHEQALARERERSDLVGAVLDGHLHDGRDLWETVEALRLPHDGRYVVVAGLNRVTEHTGRSLTDPHAVTELTLALQADYLPPAA
jgi:hypothetical protein